MSDSLKKKFKANCERKGWDVLKPSHVSNDSDGRRLSDVFSEDGKEIGGELFTKIKELVAKIDN